MPLLYLWYDWFSSSNFVGMYILSELNAGIPEIDGGLYRDDTLFIIRKPTPRQLEDYKKKFHPFYEYFVLEKIQLMIYIAQ